MYLGIDVHKRYAQEAVMDEAGKVVEEVRVENANLDDLAQRYAGAQAVFEAIPSHSRQGQTRHPSVTGATVVDGVSHIVNCFNVPDVPEGPNA